ncbi:DUF6236 family protein [Pedobacter sp. GR22-10]|uniref:DUF6236 family protein n=1 Tax=Pedobacter sp. GR22-10 TaxID=2994472 RepID=UPI002245B4A5|nr:DUF6236 family protein [Pedobacter sp. GR22-10]MCX2431112.1 DUF6236 family protein [Pedobacter sp. GR22-10]
MNRTILYYPTIDIPSNSWLRHAILYWDEVSSIVPKSYDNRMLSELSPDIHYLIAEGQFRPIKPEDLIYKDDNWDALHQFRNEFTETVASPAFQQFIQRQQKSQYRIHIDKIGRDDVARIHNNKITDGIFHFLEEQGLAKRDNRQYEWVTFEKHTALLYMSLLAKYLADVDSEQTTIGTDLSTYEKFNFKRVKEKEGFPVVSFNLDNVLPSPKANVPLEKILDFKRKREQNLLHFKKYLSDFQVKVSKTKSQAELKEVAITFQEGLVTGVEDLKAVLSDSKIESGFKSFKALINLKSPTMFATAGALLNDKFDLVNLPVSLASIGLATIGAIELTGNYIELKNKERAKLRESPFSYIYQAQRYGLLNRTQPLGQ